MEELSQFFETLILYCIDKFNGERSIYAIQHMLKGKKSSQTIQDAHLFKLTDVFGTFPDLSRHDLEVTIQFLARDKKINGLNRDDYYLINTKGRDFLKDGFKENPLPLSLDGMSFQNASHVFWERLSLLIQTLSHIIYMQKRFYPIQRNTQVQAWVRNFFNQNRRNREELGQAFFKEIEALLETRSAIEQNLFIKRLTSHHRVGSTYEQIADELERDELYIRYLFLGMIHFIIREVNDHSTLYPLLYSILYDLQNANSYLTDSTRLTFRYLQQGKKLPEIAKIRHLKLNTIEDHLVEIAHSDVEFLIDEYVSTEEIHKIRRAVEVSKTKQLKVIKKMVDDDRISFFQIRLVLAKEGDEG